MGFATLLPVYFLWHYTTALRDLIGLWGNFLWFVLNFFSVGLLARTLFSPWRRLKEYKRSRGLDLGEALGNAAVNLIMRLVGVFVRAATIIAGLVVGVFVLASGVVAFFVWLAMPAVLLALIGGGFAFLFQ